MKKEWTLPKPKNVDGEYEYFPVVRVSRVIPFGYEQDPDDPDILLPIKKELDLLEQAKKHLKKYSLRAVSDWLSHESGRSISYTGLRGRVKLEKQRQTEATNQRLLAERYKEAIEKAKKLEERRLGGKGLRATKGSSDTDSSSN